MQRGRYGGYMVVGKAVKCISSNNKLKALDDGDEDAFETQGLGTI